MVDSLSSLHFLPLLKPLSEETHYLKPWAENLLGKITCCTMVYQDQVHLSFENPSVFFLNFKSQTLMPV